MANPKPLTDDRGEVRELTAEDFARAIPFSALPENLKKLLGSQERVVRAEADAKESSQPAA